MIDRLRQAVPEDRPGIITELYDRNRAFFSGEAPEINSFLERTECPYHLNITDRFIDIVHTPSGELAHPETGLDVFAEVLAGSAHSGWQNLMNCQRIRPVRSPLHCRYLESFEKSMTQSFPEAGNQIESGNVRVSTKGASETFSPPVVFAGIFHGLHIEQFLRNNLCTRFLMVEIEPERFEVSCYFLDYKRLFERYGVLPINIGADISRDLQSYLHSTISITSRLWMRVLPAYDSKRTGHVVEQVRLQQHILDGTTTSLDNEINGISAGWQAVVHDRYPVLTAAPALAERARIVIVASGPSLEKSYDWLHENRNNLIIFAVHSAVKPLRAHGINPDLQFSIDMHIPKYLADALELAREKPLVCYYKSSRPILSSGDLTLLVSERDIANPIEFTLPLTNTHPSTATLACAFACFCRPREVIFAGLDLGFRNPEQQAISGGVHDLREKQKDQFFIDAGNFPGTGGVYSNPFFQKVKVSLETIIKEYPGKIDFINISDGVRINGAEPVESKNLVLDEYPEKSEDLQKIQDAFAGSEEGRNWNRYPMTGAVLLEQYKQALREQVSLREWNWPQFCLALDSLLASAMQVCRERSTCLRMTIYERLINDLLTSWYLYMLLSKDPETAERVYRVGKEQFLEVIDDLTWPIDEEQVSN